MVSSEGGIGRDQRWHAGERGEMINREGGAKYAKMNKQPEAMMARGRARMDAESKGNRPRIGR